MSITLGIGIYVICWWVALFAVLPFGIRTQGECGTIEAGTPESAPQFPRLLPKLVATTIIAAMLFGLIYSVYSGALFTLDDIPLLPRFGKT